MRAALLGLLLAACATPAAAPETVVVTRPPRPAACPPPAPKPDRCVEDWFATHRTPACVTDWVFRLGAHAATRGKP